MAKKTVLTNKTVLTDTPKNLVIRYKEYLQKNWSDLDLCIVSKTFGKDGHNELVLLKQLSSDIDPMIEAHPYHPIFPPFPQKL